MTIKNLVFAANNETLVGEEWSLLYDRGSSSYRSVCWDGSKFVAAAQYRTMRSSDGIDWTIERSNLPATQIRRLEYGNGVYVAATNSGYFVSSDLISWTQVLNAFTNPFALRFKYGKFYSVVGISFMSSTDGINWTTISSNSMTGVAQDIEFASESNIVIVGSNSFITSSSDGGLTWIDRTSPIANTAILGIARSNSLYAARTSTQIITSPDGITWTARTSNISSNSYWIHWSGTIFTLVGTGENATSTDGITWTRRVVSGTHYGITSSPTTHIMVGANAIVSSSSDGLTYTRRNRIPRLNFSLTEKGSIIWDGSRYVSTSIGASAGISYSTNLRDWTLSTNSSTVDSSSSNLCYNGSVYVAGGNRLMYTNNLTSNWTQSSYPTGTGFSRKIIWDGSKFVAAGGLSSSSAKTNIVTSTNGVSWTARFEEPESNRDLYDLAYSGSVYVAVGAGGRIIRSLNGITWTIVSSPVTNGLFRIIWTGNEFYIPNGTSPLKSSDGLTWTVYTSNENIIDIIWTNNIFVGSSSNNLFYSSDGLNWIPSASVILSSASAYTSLFYVNDRLFALSPVYCYTSPQMEVGYR